MRGKTDTSGDGSEQHDEKHDAGIGDLTEGLAKPLDAEMKRLFPMDELFQ